MSQLDDLVLLLDVKDEKFKEIIQKFTIMDFSIPQLLILKEMNRKTRLSSQEIETAGKVKKSSANTWIRRLIEMGLVERLNIKEGKSGRPKAYYRLVKR